MPNWTIIEAKDGQLRGGKSNRKHPAGYYLRSEKKPTTYEMNNFAPFKARVLGRPIGWVVPAEDWSMRLMLGVKTPSQNIESIEWTQNNKFLEEIKPKLRPFQNTLMTYSLGFMIKNGHFRKTLVAPLGSGKTLMTLLMAKVFDLKLLVVAPRYLHAQWKKEANKWGFDEPEVTTYESAHKFHHRDDLEMLVFDENLRTKNPEAQRTINCAKLAENKLAVIGMTATPTSSKGASDWRHINVVTKGAFPSNENAIRFLFGKNPRFETKWGGHEILEIDGWREKEVASFISPYVYTITEDEVAESLPEVTYHQIDLETPEDWDWIADGNFTDLSSSKAVSQARQATSGFYYDDDKDVVEHNTIKMDWIKNFIKDNPTLPIVIFSTYIESQRKLKEALSEYEPSTIASGVDSGPEIERFLSGETKILICSAQLTEGFNIHEVCCTAIFESNGLSPIMRKQAIGRLKRPDAPRPVQIYDLLCENTLDQRLLEILTEHINFSESQVMKLLKAEVI